jgi:DNA-directed RNA polymerase beta' subunit
MQSERISKADSVKSRAESIDAKDDTLENTTNASTRKLSSNMDAQSDHIGADQTDNDEDQEDDTGNTV